MLADVNFSWSGLNTTNLDRCLALWGDREAYEPLEFAGVLDRVRRLLSEERARGRLILDQRGEVRAFGVTVFVDDPTANDLATTLHPQLGKRLLQHPDWNTRILGIGDIGQRNATSGLQMVVVNQGYDDSGLTDEGWTALLGALIQSFIEAHRGFRLKRTIIEAFGRRGVDYVARSWPNVARSEVPMKNRAKLWTARWAVTRVEAEQQGGALLPLFLYRPPVLALTPSEKAVLRVALDGVTDQAIADALGIPIASVKSRWSRMFRRVAQTTLGPQFDPGKRSGGRGPRARHLIVEHVRQNPSELTPFESVEAPKRHARVTTR